MGKLVDGMWRDEWYDTGSTGGRFVRRDAQFRNWITADGSAGPSGDGGFAAEVGRYHLYVSLACPWAHRTLILRKLKGLEAIIPITVAGPAMLENGWEIAVGGDSIHGAQYMHQVYTAAEPGYTGRVTVPVLWDKRRRTIVNNELSEIIRMFNGAFDGLDATPGDFYPAELRAEIDAVNAKVYEAVNNGVYKTGFATAQAAYEEAFAALFAALDEIDAHLGGRRYLVGGRITEADWRLFTTLVRFDAVYFAHFKCNRRMIADYANLPGYLRELYQIPGVAETVDLDFTKTHYYGSQPSINPSGIVPVGPDIDLTSPHGRDQL